MFEEYTLMCRLDDIIEARRLTYKDVERLSGVHYNVIRRMAHTQTSGIDFDVMKRLCLGLGISPSDLFAIDVRNEKSASSSD
jgi:DNA-binding Xre family transcriptional regulator